MNSYLIIGFSCATLLLLGCSVGEAENNKVKSDKDAQVRAEAARKEMELLPKTFRTPDYFKKNEPEQKAVVSPAKK